MVIWGKKVEVIIAHDYVLLKALIIQNLLVKNEDAQFKFPLRGQESCLMNFLNKIIYKKSIVPNMQLVKNIEYVIRSNGWHKSKKI